MPDKDEAAKKRNAQRKEMIRGGYKTFLDSPAGKDFIEYLLKTRENAHFLAEERIVTMPGEDESRFKPLDETTMAMLLGAAKNCRDITAYVKRRAGVIDNKK